MEFLKKNRKKVAFIFVVLVVCLIGIFIYTSTTAFKVVSVSPNTQSISYLTPQFIVNFNRDIDSNSVSISSNNISVSQKVTGKELRIFLGSSLVPNASYSIVISSVSSVDHAVIKDYVLSFTAASETDSLSPEDQKLILDTQQAHKDTALKDKIFGYLPYYKDTYYLAAVIGSDGQTITISATIFLSRSDMSNKDGAINTAKKSIQGYLSTLSGIDISKYAITYSIQEP